MLRFTGTVVYRDGREERFAIGMVAVSMYERYAVRHGLPTGREMLPQTLQDFAAFTALGNGAGFDAWIETVDGVYADEIEELPPTPSEVSDD